MFFTLSVYTIWNCRIHINLVFDSCLIQYPELLVASYTNNEDAPHEPDGVALVWNMKFKKTTPEYTFHCQVHKRMNAHTHTPGEAAEGKTAHNNVWNGVNGMVSNTWKPCV